MSQVRRNRSIGRLGQFTSLVDVPTVPEDLTAISDEDLGTLHAELDRHYQAERAACATLEAVSALQPTVNALAATLAETARRYAAVEPVAVPGDVAAALAALDATLAPEPVAPIAPAPAAAVAPVPVAVAPPAPPADPPAAPAAADAPVTEPVVAAAPRVAVTSEPTPLPPLPSAGGRGPNVSTVAPLRPAMTITAAGEIPGYTSGQSMGDIDAVGQAIFEKRAAIGRPGPGVGSDLITVASVHLDYPEERHLRSTDSLRVIQDKVDGVTSLEAITAAGGLCAPVEPYYDIMTIAEATRPVQAGLATYQADRGGIRLIPPPQFSDAAGAIGFITAAQDAAALGGNAGQIAAATKPCLHVTCPGVVEYDTAAITRCLEFGNLTAKTYPEQVGAWVKLAAAQWARKAETALIDGIAAKSTQVTLASTAGAARDIVSGIIKAAAYYRNRNRTNPDLALRVMLPAWVIDLMIVDLTKGSGYEVEYFAMARQQIAAALAEVNVNVTFYLDSGTGKGQLINSGNVITAGAMCAFPSTVVWYMFSEGSFLFLDTGQLDLGVVRDASLNSLNNYRLFAESWETVAFVGVESLEGTQSVVANGTFAGPAYGSTTIGSPQAIPSTY